MAQPAGSLSPVPPPPNPAPNLSLLTVASEIRDGARWESGFVFTPERCFAGSILEVCPPSPVQKQTGNDRLPRPVFPPVLEADDYCGTFGSTQRDRQSLAERLLDRSHHKLAEAEFWSGAIGGWAAAAHTRQPFTVTLPGGFVVPGWNPTLASPGAFILNANAGTALAANLAATQFNLDANIAAAEAAVITPSAGLAALEAALADCSAGGPGYIHASRDLVGLWFTGNALRVEGGQILTAMNNIVIPGPGYSGVAPPTTADIAAGLNFHAPPAGTAWAYATGPVVFRRGVVETIGGERETITGGPSQCLQLGQRIALNIPVDFVLEDVSGTPDYQFTLNDLSGSDALQALFDCLTTGPATQVLVLTFRDSTGAEYTWQILQADQNTLFPTTYVGPGGPLEFTLSYSPPSANGCAGELGPAAEAESLRYLNDHGGPPGPSPLENGTLVEAYCATQGANSLSNDVESHSERLFAAYWDECCHLAVLVDAC